MERLVTGKSKEEIAFELVAKLKGVGVWGENNRAEILDMYAECLEATSGLRKVKGVTSAVAANAPAPQQFAPQTVPQAPAPQRPPQPVQQAAPQLTAPQPTPLSAPAPQGYAPAPQPR